MSDEEKPPAEPLQIVRIERRRGEYCGHRETLVCEEERTVECKRCGAKLDPIAVLLMLANNADRYAFATRHARNESNRLHAELEDLKRQIRNAKATLRRRTAPPAEVLPDNVHALKGRRS